jgi:hypothetical protein
MSPVREGSSSSSCLLRDSPADHTRRNCCGKERIDNNTRTTLQSDAGRPRSERRSSACRLRSRAVQNGAELGCLGCRLRWYVRRADLARSVRTKAVATEDPKERALLDRLAALFEPYHNPRYTYGALPPDDPLTRGVPERDALDA